MVDIYEQHQKAFERVSAFVVTDNSGQRVANIAFKFPEDGAGRLYCYFHLFGTEMVRGHANGYGYDKKSAACRDAIDKLKVKDGCDPAVQKLMYVLQSYGKAMDSGNFDNVLRNAGYNVLQAV